MKPVQAYQSDDGMLWLTAEAASLHEQLVAERDEQHRRDKEAESEALEQFRRERDAESARDKADDELIAASGYHDFDAIDVYECCNDCGRGTPGHELYGRDDDRLDRCRECLLIHLKAGAERELS